MQVLSPQFWWFGFLALIPIALYLFRRRSRIVTVSTLVFFKTLAKEHQESSWLRRLKRILSFLLTLLMLSLVVASLARIVFVPRGEAVRNVVILVDRSASMGARDAAGQTRLEVARDLIRKRLDGVGPRIAVSLLAYDTRTEVVQSRNFRRRDTLSSLEKLVVRPVAGNAAEALRQAEVLAALKAPAEIWHVTDAAGEEPAVVEEDAGQVRVRRWVVAAPEAINVGFTGFQIRKVPMQNSRFVAFARVECNAAAPGPVEVELRVRLGGVDLAPRQLTLEPGGMEAVEIPVQGARDQLLELRLVAKGDCLEVDNVIVAPLPNPDPMLVARVGTAQSVDPYVQLALQSLIERGRMQVVTADPSQWPVEGLDVVIFDGWLPEQWPEDVPAVVINPPASVGPVRIRTLAGGGIPHRELRVEAEDHPLLYRVSSSRIQVTQTSVLDVSGPWETLWEAEREPVLAAGIFGDQRVVVMPFSPARSPYLPMTASFPLLIGNAIYWCAEGSESDREGLQEERTGEVIRVEGESIRWREVAGSGLRSARDAVQFGVVELGRSGIWETESGDRGTAYLLSRAETDVPALVAGPDEERSALGGGLGGEITTWLLAALLVVLVLESVLFHRFGVF